MSAVITCVLEGSWPQDRPDLGPRYAQVLRDMCARHAPGVPFVCFADREIPGVEVRRLPPGLPEWWGKIYAMAPEHFPVGTRLLGLDLDTVVAGSLEPVLSVPLDLPVFIKGCWSTPPGQAPIHRSGVHSLMVSEKTHLIWHEFTHPPQLHTKPPFWHPRIGKRTGLFNDEQWFGMYIQGGQWRGWHELLPGAVVGYKTDLHQSMQPLEKEVAVVYFDGRPRPHDVVADWNPHNIHGADGYVTRKETMPICGSWRNA